MIKPNIDLTSNEMFSKQRIGIGILPKHLIVGSLFPWDFKNYIGNGEKSSPAYELVLTGDKPAREMKKTYLDLYSGNYCDCCGAPLATIPWDRTYGLCKKCMIEVEQHLQNTKYPWEERI